MTHESCQNNDRELWREHPDDFYADSIHVTDDGRIGINVGGHVIVAPVARWHEAGLKLFNDHMATVAETENPLSKKIAEGDEG